MFIMQAISEGFIESSPQGEALSLLLPYLRGFGIVSAQASISEIRELDLWELASYWGVGAVRGAHSQNAFEKRGKAMQKASSTIKSDQLLILLANKALTFDHKGESLAMKLIRSNPNHLDNWFSQSSRPEITNSPGETSILGRKAIHVPFSRNYYGLPPVVNPTTSDNLLANCRKPLLTSYRKETKDSWENTADHSDQRGQGSDGSERKAHQTISDSNVDAQRKVAVSLLTMSKNEAMTHLFIDKGGIDAVFRLLGDTSDSQVLRTLAQCLLQSVGDSRHTRLLLNKGVLSSICALAEKGDDEIHNYCAKILVKLTASTREQPHVELTDIKSQSPVDALSSQREFDIDEGMVLGGILPLTSQLIASSSNSQENSTARSNETLCLSLISAVNIASALMDADVETLVRIVFQSVKRLDVSRRCSHALFIIDIIANLTRVQQFCTPLVEESVLPMLLHLMEIHPTNALLEKGSEAFLNISSLRRNRREIASSGIASHLDKLFSVTYGSTRPNTLTMVGNLLDSGLFHDRIAKVDIVGNILANMFEYTPTSLLGNLDEEASKRQYRALQQFIAVSFFLAQLALVHVNSAAVLVECGAIEKVLNMIRVAGAALEAAPACQYLWTFLVNISREAQFFPFLMGNSDLLLREVAEEAEGAATGLARGAFSEEAAQLVLNLSIQPELAGCLREEQANSLVNSLKMMVDRSQGPIASRLLALKALVNICMACAPARANTLKAPIRVDKSSNRIDSKDEAPKFNLIVMLEAMVENLGNLTKVDICCVHVLFASLLNSLSLEEALIGRLMEIGVLKFLLHITEKSFTPPSSSRARAQLTPDNDNGFSKSIRSPRSKRETRSQGANSPHSAGASPNKSHMRNEATTSFISSLVGVNGNSLAPQSSAIALPGQTELKASSSLDMELGKKLVSATIHNIMIKRSTIIPGTIPCIFALLRNCRDCRVVLCMRALAHMSTHPKSKISLAKEKKLVPEIAAIMRLGCEDADRVQHFGAIVICNILATQVDKLILDELITSGAVVDLVVVTLLRINGMKTKETLGKSLFNLLARGDFRKQLVLGGAAKGDLLGSIIELSRVDATELVELCAQTLYNISCEIGGASRAHSSSLSEMSAEITYSDKIAALHAPAWLISKLIRSTSSVISLGVKANASVRQLAAKTITNLSYDRKLAVEIAGHPQVVDSIKAISVLPGEQSLVCAVTVLYNLSHTHATCTPLYAPDADHGVDVIMILVSGLRASSMLAVQTSCAALVNFSRHVPFYEALTTHALTEVIKILGATHMHLHVKLDAIRCLHNLVTQHRAARVVAIECDAAAALWKLLKITNSGRQGQGEAKHTSPRSMNVHTPTIAGGEEDSEQDDVAVIHVIGKIVQELCTEAENDAIHRKLLHDGLMNVLLRLAKIEVAELKLDVSFALLSLTSGCWLHGQDIMGHGSSSSHAPSLKVLKWDAIDILFWLTLHDCLALNDSIMKNVSRTLRSFSLSQQEAEILAKEERFISVLRALIKSKNEDVLWHTAGVVYNILSFEACKKVLLSKGIIAFIFELAASGYDSVRHVCSASLHLLQGQLPNMDDPAVLQLLWCLLEADGEKLNELKQPPNLPQRLDQTLPATFGALYENTNSSFTPSWLAYTCEVDIRFQASQIKVSTGEVVKAATIGLPSASKGGSTRLHEKRTPSYYPGLLDDLPPASEVTIPPLSRKMSMATIRSSQSSTYSEGEHLSTPALESLRPLSHGMSMSSASIASMSVSENRRQFPDLTEGDDYSEMDSLQARIEKTSKAEIILPGSILKGAKRGSVPQDSLAAIKKSIALDTQKMAEPQHTKKIGFKL